MPGEGICSHFGKMTQPGLLDKLDKPLKEIYAKSLLLFVKYKEEASNLESNVIMRQYKQMMEVCL